MYFKCEIIWINYKLMLNWSISQIKDWRIIYGAEDFLFSSKRIKIVFFNRRSWFVRRKKKTMLRFRNCETVKNENRQVALLYIGTHSSSLPPLTHLILIYFIPFQISLMDYLVLHWNYCLLKVIVAILFTQINKVNI